MRRVSAKRRSHNAAVKPVRDEYRYMFPKCQVPWCKSQGAHIHEISRGPARGASLGVRAALLHVCPTDHRQMEVLPVEAQLALKKIADPDGYDRVAVNRLRGRQPEAITEAEVLDWVETFGHAVPVWK